MGLVPGKSQYNYDHSIPCRNPHCRSFGKPHFNCVCSSSGPHTGAPGPSGPSSSITSRYAHGGEVHFCDSNQPHEKHCPYYAEGGPVQDAPAPLPAGESDDPSSTLGHAAIEHGLIGLLGGSIGDPHLSDPDQAMRTLDEAKKQHRFRANPPSPDGLEDVGPKKTQGSKFGNHIFEGKHADSAETMQDHPLVGSVGKGALEPILQRLSGPTLERESNPHAFRGSVDYLHSSARGHKKMTDEMKTLMEHGKPATHMQEMSRESARNELKEKLESIQANPEQLLDIGGSLGHYLPDHAGQLGATAAQATDYLNSIRPKSMQSGPLDPVSPPDSLAQDSYNRQLDIANHPLLVLSHIRDGTLHPQDMTTLQTIYPGLHKSLVSKINEEIINAKSEDRDIPYKHRLALSLAVGQPLDGTMTSEAMMAIIASQGGGNTETTQGGGKSVTAATQKTLQKTDALYQTPDQAREIHDKA